MSWTPHHNEVVYKDSLESIVDAISGTGIVSGMAVTPGSSGSYTITIASGTYKIGGTKYSYSGVTNHSLSSNIPSTTNYYQYVLVSVNSSGGIVVSESTEASATSDLVMDYTSSSGNCKVATIQLRNGQTTIDSAEILDSARMVVAPAIDLANDATGILPSANMDADTAHLSGTQTFTGAKTFEGFNPVRISYDDSGNFTFGPILTFKRDGNSGFQSKINFEGYISQVSQFATMASIDQRVSATYSDSSGWGGSLHFSVKDAEVSTSTVKEMLLLSGGSRTVQHYVASEAIADLTTGSSANVFINSSDGKLQRSTSSQRYKTNLQDIPYDRTAFHNVTPRLFESTISNELDENGLGVQRWGLIAEDLQTAFGDTIIDFNDNEEVENYDTRGIIAVMYQEIKNLKAEIDELKNNNGG